MLWYIYAVKTKKTSKNRLPVWILVVGGILLYGALSYWLVTSFFLNKGTSVNPPFSTNSKKIPTPTHSPRPIPSGKKTFSVSSGKKTGPLFGEGAIDPYDPKIKATQTISVAITGTKPVTTATLTMQTDTKTKKVPMKIISGTNTNGVWEGSWTVDDSYLFTYVATITASDNTETNKIDLTLR